jgi:hypothetical protein
MKDVVKYSNKSNLNLMKVCKRLFILSLQENNDKLKQKLIYLFESDLGKLYKIKSEIDTIINVIQKKYNHETNDYLHVDIDKALENLKTKLSMTKYNFNETYYKLLNIPPKLPINKLEKAYLILNNFINIKVKEYTYKNNIKV